MRIAGVAGSVVASKSVIKGLAAIKTKNVVKLAEGVR